MRKLVSALAGCLAVMLQAAPGVQADLTASVTATLSCTDGHSVVLTVDQATLAGLATDVQAVNASGTNLCTLDTAAIDPSSESSEWTVFDYNPSGQAIAPRNSPSKMPATTPDAGTTWQFNFRRDVFTALFTTTDPNLTGNLCPMFPAGCRQLTENVQLNGDAVSFSTQRGGGDCVGNKPAAVRFYFVSPSASGSSVGTPPAGFYTRFWWSDFPVEMQFVNGLNQVGSFTVNLNDLAEWSDWNGQRASNPAVTEAFIEATQKVQSIGLSFGGDCFFETGVTPDQPWTNETFSSQFSE